MKVETVICDDIDYTVYVGENAADNDKIIKSGRQNDLWLHFESISSPHLVLSCEGQTVSKRCLYMVAQLLWKYKPKAPHNQGVIYTEIKNVKLTNVPGSVLTKRTQRLKLK
jgi:predicted ribosome quality control (RQC) complex YloA/Tae2 family protein